MRVQIRGPRFLPPLPVVYISLFVLDGLCLLIFAPSPLPWLVLVFAGLLTLDVFVHRERPWALYARAIAGFLVGWFGTAYGFGRQPPPNGAVIAGAPQFLVCAVLFAVVAWRQLRGE
ncbi:MAG: hypothetical protein ABFS86_16315 [Planctomycetota bacterium]